MRISARSVAALGAIALALGNLGRLPAGVMAGRNAPVTLADLVTILVWILLLGALASGRLRVVLDDVVVAAAAFVGVAALSTALAFPRYGLGVGTGAEVVAFFARWCLYFGWYPFVAWCLTADESQSAVRYVDRALLAIAGFGVFQSLLFPGFGQLVQIGGAPEWEYQGRRLVSTMLDPNFAGAMIVLALLPRLARLAEGERPHPLGLVVLAAALLLTASRSAVLAVAAGLFVIVVARGVRAKLVRVMLVGALLVTPFIPLLISYANSLNKLQLDGSAGQRFVTWKRAWTLFAEHPALGIGFNSTRVAQAARGWQPIGGGDTAFDGGIFFVAVMTGIVGASLYLLMLWQVMRAARRVWNDAELPSAHRAHATGTAAVTVGIVVQSFFTNSLLLPFVMQVLWIMWGRLAHLAAERRRRWALVAALPLVAAAASCAPPPCRGTEVCPSDWLLQVGGSVVDASTGAPVRGAGVEVTFSGAAGTRSVVATTDGDGWWGATGAADCCDKFFASVVIRAPGHQAYFVPDFPVRTTRTSGEAQLVGTWTNRPYVRFVFSPLFNNATVLPGAAVEFRQTGGVSLSGPLTATADGVGIAMLEASADRLGDAFGTLVITHSALPYPISIPGIRIPVRHTFGIVKPVPIPVYD
jgi:O-antigen ligase